LNNPHPAKPEGSLKVMEAYFTQYCINPCQGVIALIAEGIKKQNKPN